MLRRHWRLRLLDFLRRAATIVRFRFSFCCAFTCHWLGILQITIRIGIVLAQTVAEGDLELRSAPELNNCRATLYRKPTLLRRIIMAKKSAKSHRELIDTGTDKRYVRRDDQGRFKEV